MTRADFEEMRSLARQAGDERMELAANSAFAVLYSTATPKFDPDLGAGSRRATS